MLTPTERNTRRRTRAPLNGALAQKRAEMWWDFLGFVRDFGGNLGRFLVEFSESGVKMLTNLG